MQTQTPRVLRVGSILPGNNPRQYFDPAEMATLEGSIKVHGVIQPVLVRPVEGGYALVAGERRCRGARNVFGDDYEIPVLVKESTEDQAEDLALIENVARSNMSPTEEAEAAAKHLGRSDGNRDEAAQRLGMNRATFDKRLALMNCSEGVKKALNERKITLGHAELLAAVTKDKQESVISKLLAAPALPTVAQFKAQLESISKSLATAIFPLDECAGCHHNSGNQQALFAEAVTSGHCTNGVCFDKKMTDKLEETKKSLEDTFPRVQILQPGENYIRVKLVAEGATGVGEAQASACRACQKFGAAVSNIPGSIGQAYINQCFDSSCNTQKVGERLKAEKEAAKPPAPAVTAKAEGATSSTGVTVKEQSKPAKLVKAAATQVQDSQRVSDYRTTIWRAVLKKELFANQRENLSVLIAIMMTKGGSNVSTTKMSGAFEKMTGGRPSNSSSVGQAATLVSNADDSVRSQMLSGIVISIMEGIDKSVLPELLAFMEVDLANHWKLNVEFLDLLTKSEIEVIAEELGLKAALGDKYSKAMGGKKTEIIKALLAIEGFDYVGKVPSVLQYATV